MNVIRGSFGTDAVTHETRTPVKELVYFNDNIIDVLYSIFVDHLGINPIYIPYNNDPGNPDEWDIEKANWLVNALVNNRVSTKIKASEILAEICQQFSITLWWNEREQKIKLSGSTIQLGNVEPILFNSDHNILSDSFSVVTKNRNRFTQMWVYYDKKNQSVGNDTDNYSALDIYVSADAENDNAYGRRMIKTVLSNWLDDTNAVIVPGIANRLIESDLQQAYDITFELDAADAQLLWAGEYCLLSNPAMPDEHGNIYIQKVHILQVSEVVPGHRYRYKGKSTVYDDLLTFGYFAFIAENTLIDYISSTEQEKDENWFLSDGANDFADGRPPYRLTG